MPFKNRNNILFDHKKKNNFSFSISFCLFLPRQIDKYKTRKSNLFEVERNEIFWEINTV